MVLEERHDPGKLATIQQPEWKTAKEGARDRKGTVKINLPKAT